jgi:linoleoyl-CoA desaturase
VEPSTGDARGVLGDKQFAVLRGRLHSLGLLKKEVGPIILQMIFFGALMVLGVGGVVWGSWWMGGVGFLLLLGSTLGLSTVTHTASHQAASQKRWVNSLLVYIGYPFLLGMSATYWHRRHIQLHHAHTNVVGVDDDIEQRPVMTLVRDHRDSASIWGRRWYDTSRFLLPVLMLGNGPTVQFSSFVWAVRQMLSSKARWSHVADVLALIGHYILWIGLPLFYFGVSEVIIFHLLWSIGVGYLLYCTFVPAHLPEEAIFVLPSSGEDYVMRQTATTINFHAGRVHSAVIAGLQYQIEHHLFPGASHVHLPAISAYVEEFCREHGYPYRTLPYGEALWKATLCFFKPKAISSFPERG